MFRPIVAQAQQLGKTTAAQRDAALADFIGDFMRRTLTGVSPERQAHYADESLARLGDADRWDLYQALEVGA